MLGGLSGVWLALVPVDIHVSDTYFVVAHIHYVLFGGSVFTIYAGLYYWYPKMTGKMYDERLGKLHFWLTFVSFNATFFPMHYSATRGHDAAHLGLPAELRELEHVHHAVGVRARGLDADLRLQRDRSLAARASPRRPTRGARSRSSGRSRSPPPVFNFDAPPRIVGGPYNYGQPGARHAIVTVHVPPRRRRSPSRSPWPRSLRPRERRS